MGLKPRAYYREPKIKLGLLSRGFEPEPRLVPPLVPLKDSTNESSFTQCFISQAKIFWVSKHQSNKLKSNVASRPRLSDLSILVFNWNGPIFENRQAKVFRDIDSGGGDFIGPNRLQQLLAPKMVRFRKEVVLDQRYSWTLKSNCSCCHDGTMTLVLMSISLWCNEDIILLRNLTNLPFQHSYELVSGNCPTQIIHTVE